MRTTLRQPIQLLNRLIQVLKRLTRLSRMENRMIKFKCMNSYRQTIADERWEEPWGPKIRGIENIVPATPKRHDSKPSVRYVFIPLR
mmetsp:Transcript_31888/g.77713  ORF Transcript_31888/g.77713 Transcript_31888/m.77713 type:complete len:87 (-) Transcript_31888:55-315(-)